MPTVVSRTYSDHATAHAAAAALKESGFSDSAVHLSQGEDGQATVSAHAEFGEGQRATRVLDSFNPIASSSAASSHSSAPAYQFERGGIADEAAPFSHAIGAPLLSSIPTPFSKWLGLPVLSASQAPSAGLTHSPSPLSSALGLPTILRDKLSQAKLHADDPAPFSKAVGLKTLSADPTPFSSWLKLPVLSKESRHEPT